MAATKQQIRAALLTEHFRYTPLSLLDDIINIANEIVYRYVTGLDDGLRGPTPEQLGFTLDPDTAARLPTKDARREAVEELKQNEIDSGVVQLESLLYATLDKDFDKFEIYTLRNILAVGHDEDNLANWVQLDHYKGIEIVNMENAITPEQVQRDRLKLHETAKLNATLKAEDAKNTAILSQLSSLIGADVKQEGGETASPFAFLNSASSAGQPQHLTADTQAAMAQVETMQQLLAQLKDALQTVSTAGAVKLEDDDSNEARRRHYLEYQSRQALEKKGIDPDASTGASLAAGRKMGRDELEGIESVVQALGGAEKG